MAQKAKKDIVLRIEPDDDCITFRGNFTSEVTVSYLDLHNPSNAAVAFKVKTTAPRRYCVRPNSGKIKPDEKIQVKILLQPSSNNEDLSKHKFLVQTIELNDDLVDIEVDDLFKNKNIESCSKKLLCKFIEPDETNQEPQNTEQVANSEKPPSYTSKEESSVPEYDTRESIVRKVEEPKSFVAESSVLPSSIDNSHQNQIKQEIVNNVQEPEQQQQQQIEETNNNKNIQETDSNSNTTQKQQTTNKIQFENKDQKTDISRPKISAVPTEPKVINPSNKTQKVQNTSNYTTIRNEELKGLKDSIKNLENKLKSAVADTAQLNVSSSLPTENNLFWKSLLIIGILCFIFGWMLSSMLCRC